MSKLSKEQIARYEAFAKQLGDAKGELENAVLAFNDKIDEAWADVEAAQTAMNEVVQEANAFCQEVADEAQGEFDDRSEKWQEGERGEAVATWIEEWAGLELEEADYFKPDALEEPEVDVDSFECLRLQASS